MYRSFISCVSRLIVDCARLERAPPWKGVRKAHHRSEMHLRVREEHRRKPWPSPLPDFVRLARQPWSSRRPPCWRSLPERPKLKRTTRPARRARRPVLPARRQRRLRRPALRPRPRLRPGDRRPDRHGDHQRPRHQNLSRFNLDLDGLTVRSSRSTGAPPPGAATAASSTVTPARGLPEGAPSRPWSATTGCRETLPDGVGFLHTDDGAVVAGQPHVAATWFPVNDHPSDKASYTFNDHRPRGLEVVANGVAESAPRGRADHLDLGRRRADGVVPGHDGDRRVRRRRLPRRTASGTGTRSTPTCSTRRRATHRRAVRLLPGRRPDLQAPEPAPSRSRRRRRSCRSGSTATPSRTGTSSSSRPTPSAQDDWTTLPDANGHTSQDTGFAARSGSSLHPFLAHYQTPAATCAPDRHHRRVVGGHRQRATATSSGASTCRRLRRQHVEVSISYASDDIIQARASSSTTSSSRPARARPHSRTTATRSTAGPCRAAAGQRAATPTTGRRRRGRRAADPRRRSPRARSSGSRRSSTSWPTTSGRYPFSAAGGIVDDSTTSASPWRPRPGRSTPAASSATESGDSVVVHELAHQWFGDSLAVERWQHIWLNEGFATYAEWLWSEREGWAPPRRSSRTSTTSIPADDPFWDVTIGEPGPGPTSSTAPSTTGAR